MATNIKFHRITATSGSAINTGTTYKQGEVYFIKSAAGNTGKVYICTKEGKGTAATLEDYSVDTNTWRPLGTGADNAAAGNHTHTGSEVKLTGYSKASSYSAIAASDTVNQAIGKLEGAISGLEDLLASI